MEREKRGPRVYSQAAQTSLNEYSNIDMDKLMR